MELYTDATVHNNNAGRYGVLIKNKNKKIGFAMVNFDNVQQLNLTSTQLERSGIRLAQSIKELLSSKGVKDIEIYSDQQEESVKDVQFNYLESQHKGNGPAKEVHDFVKESLLLTPHQKIVQDFVLNEKKLDLIQELVLNMENIKQQSNLDILVTIKLLSENYPLCFEFLTDQNKEDENLRVMSDLLSLIKSEENLILTRSFNVLKFNPITDQEFFIGLDDNNKYILTTSLNKSLNYHACDKEKIIAKLKKDLNFKWDYIDSVVKNQQINITKFINKLITKKD